MSAQRRAKRKLMRTISKMEARPARTVSEASRRHRLLVSLLGKDRATALAEAMTTPADETKEEA